MSASVNKVILIGNLGNDPDIRNMQSGDEIANLSIATSEAWKDKQTGERKERVQWHKVVIFNQPLVTVAKNYLNKGAKVYIEGSLETRKWQDKDGKDQYTTEVVLRPFNGALTILDSRKDGDASSYGGAEQPYTKNPAPSRAADPMVDDIPFDKMRGRFW